MYSNTGGNLVTYDEDAASTRMVIDSSGNLLVGKTSVDYTTAGVMAEGDGTISAVKASVTGVFNRLTSDGDIFQFRKDGTTVGSIGTQGGRLTIGDGATGLRIAADLNTIVPWNTTTNALRDSAIDLGQATQKFKDLYLSGGIKIVSPDTTSAAAITFGDSADAATGSIGYFNSDDSLRFSGYNNSEAMRIDSSGNLLVGKTSATASDVGIQAQPIGRLYATRDGDVPLVLRRNTSDGNIAQFLKDGTTVGSIGAKAGDLVVGTGDTGLRFSDASSIIEPHNITTNAGTDGTVDLGWSSGRFKDLYLAGDIAHKDAAGNARLLYDKSANLLGNAGTYLYGFGVYLGGTGSANLLDDYEEGTWTPTDASGDGLTLATNGSSYTKVGRLCYIYAYITYPSTASGSNQGIGGLPFTAKASATYAQLTVRVTSNTVSASNLTFQVTTGNTVGIIHSGAAAIVNSDLSTESILISGCYEVA
ncbi:hypothetical protein N9X16_04585, partial [Planktomarina temperata]|nr:hypothetical protein [Planktomarina temperata]